MEEEQRQKRKK